MQPLLPYTEVLRWMLKKYTDQHENQNYHNDDLSYWP